MFRQRPDIRPASVAVVVSGQTLRVPAGASAAAAMLLAGDAIRRTAVSGAPRAPYCMMGICFDCLAEIDGIPNRQACMVPVAEDMHICPQSGRRDV